MFCCLFRPSFGRFDDDAEGEGDSYERENRAKRESQDLIQKQFSLRRSTSQDHKTALDKIISKNARVTAPEGTAKKVKGLTVAARELYLEKLTAELLKNYTQYESEIKSDLDPRDLEECAVDMEYGVFSSNTTITMYRSAAAKILAKVKRASESAQLFEDIENYVPKPIKNESLSDLFRSMKKGQTAGHATAKRLPDDFGFKKASDLLPPLKKMRIANVKGSSGKRNEEDAQRRIESFFRKTDSAQTGASSVETAATTNETDEEPMEIAETPLEEGWGNGTAEKRPRTPEKRPRTPEKRPRTPEKRSGRPEKGAQTPEKDAEIKREKEKEKRGCEKVEETKGKTEKDNGKDVRLPEDRGTAKEKDRRHRRRSKDGARTSDKERRSKKHTREGEKAVEKSSNGDERIGGAYEQERSAVEDETGGGAAEKRETKIVAAETKTVEVETKTIEVETARIDGGTARIDGGTARIDGGSGTIDGESRTAEGGTKSAGSKYDEIEKKLMELTRIRTEQEEANGDGRSGTKDESRRSRQLQEELFGSESDAHSPLKEGPGRSKRAKKQVLKKSEVGTLVVKLLTPAYVEKRFSSRDVFKTTARNISHTVLHEDVAGIKKYVREYLKRHPKIK